MPYIGDLWLNKVPPIRLSSNLEKNTCNIFKVKSFDIASVILVSQADS